MKLHLVQPAAPGIERLEFGRLAVGMIGQSIGLGLAQGAISVELRLKRDGSCKCQPFTHLLAILNVYLAAR